MRDDQNLILIGMPGVGKSTVGVLLAKRLGSSFLDSDILIQSGERCYLHEIIAEHGIDGFCRIEERYLLTVSHACGVVATGGSVVYSPKAMAHLASLGLVVYLQIELEALTRRLGNLDERGVLRSPGQTIEMLYDERRCLYERYADTIVPTTGMTPEQVVAAVLPRLSTTPVSRKDVR